MRRKDLWNHNQEGGFTLLEVIVVLTLILLLVSLIYPISLELNNRILLKLSLKQISSDFAELHSEALSGRIPLQVIFEPEKEYYTIKRGDLVLQRPLAGLKLASETEFNIVFTSQTIDNTTLRLVAANGTEYRLSFNDLGEAGWEY
mgnify:FL=1|jgi:prepilin-type N-terminal cleavage/methylation domain-containing protein